MITEIQNTKANTPQMQLGCILTLHTLISNVLVGLEPQTHITSTMVM